MVKGVICIENQSVYAVSDNIDINVDLSEELEDHFQMVHEEDSYACDEMLTQNLHPLR